MMKRMFLVSLFLVMLVCGRNVFAMVVINEFLADPATGLAGDTNWDGIRSSSDDEFVELFNTGTASVDLSLWSLWDSTSLRHKFSSGISLFSQERLTIFGGGDLSHFLERAFKASSGTLSLNNTSDQIVLKDALGNIIDQVLFGNTADRDQSLNRFPEGIGNFRLHTEISKNHFAFSPGTDPDGNKSSLENSIASASASTSPEPSSLVLLSLGFLATPLLRKLKSI